MDTRAVEVSTILGSVWLWQYNFTYVFIGCFLDDIFLEDTFKE